MNVDEARRLAEENALVDLRGVYFGPREKILEKDYLEAEHCWMFFQNSAIVLPPERALSGPAYVFGKRGGGRCVADLRDDPAALADYLQRLSDYFATHTD